MGGIPTVAPVLPTMEEVKARLIELGKMPRPTGPQTVYMVENLTEILAYPDRSLVDNVFHAMPVGHLTHFGFSIPRMIQLRATFYVDREAALEDARSRVGGR